jgi:hypothetical protein
MPGIVRNSTEATPNGIDVLAAGSFFGIQDGRLQVTGMHARQPAGECDGDCNSVAEGVGFEPTVRFHAHTLSKRAP